MDAHSTVVNELINITGCAWPVYCLACLYLALRSGFVQPLEIRENYEMFYQSGKSQGILKFY